jgi:hypothetical protein
MGGRAKRAAEDRDRACSGGEASLSKASTGDRRNKGKAMADYTERPASFKI